MIRARNLGFHNLLDEWGTEPGALLPQADSDSTALKASKSDYSNLAWSTWSKFAQRIRLQDEQFQNHGAVQDEPRFNLHNSKILQQCNFRQYLKEGSGWEYEEEGRELLKKLFERCLSSFPPGYRPAATGPSNCSERSDNARVPDKAKVQWSAAQALYYASDQCRPP